MADTRAKLVLNKDTAVELGMPGGTLGQDVIDIRTLGPEGVFTFDSGFASTASCESKITSISGDEGVLLYRGFPTNQLATSSNYLKVCYILLNGEKPTQGRHDGFRTVVTRHTMIHEQTAHLFHAFHRDSHPVTVMCGITGVLATFYHDSLGANNPCHYEITVFRLLSEMPTTAAMCYKCSIGQPLIYPRNNLSYAGNSLDIMFSMPCEPYGVNPILERAMDRTLILHVDYEQNTSTSTTRTTGSSGANPFTYIAADTASLWRPAHGDVNETALRMLEEISSVKHIPEFVRRTRDRNDSFRLMGFDHCAYKNYGPRITAMRETCREVLRELGTKDDLLGVAMELENIAPNDPYSIEKKLYPSVDFHPGIILKAMGIPSSMFTAIFAIARAIGWIVYWNEIHNDGMKVARPRQLYTGYEKRDSKSDTKCQWLIAKPFTFQARP